MSYISGNVLDIGCGCTTLPDQLTSEQTYVGIERNQAILDFSSNNYPQHEFYLRDVDIERLGLGDRRFDTVVMSAIIEHLQSPERVLGEVRSLLTLDGLLLITTPSPFGDRVHRIGSRIGLFYNEAVAEHVTIFGQRELLNIATTCGYEVLRYHSFVMGMNQLIVCRSARTIPDGEPAENPPEPPG